MARFLTLLSREEAECIRPELEVLAAKAPVLICVLDTDEQVAIPKGCQQILPKTLLGESYRDDAFMLTRDQFTLLCAAAILKRELNDGTIIWVKPEALMEAQPFEPGENSLAVWQEPLDYHQPMPHQWDDRCVAFGCGKSPQAFIQFCFEKIRYVQAQVNGVLFSRERIPQLLCQWDFFDKWLTYAPYFGCRMEAIPGASPKKTQFQKGKYQWEKFADGTPIHMVLRELYSREYRLRFDCQHDPFRRPQRFLEWTDQLGDEYPVPLTAPMVQIHQAREDLERVFPDLRGDARLAFANWYLTNAPKEYDFPEAYFSAVRIAYEKRVKDIVDQIGDRRPLAQKLRDVKDRLRGRRRVVSPTPVAFPDTLPRMQHPQGVNICGFIQGDFGLGHSSRILADDLTSARIPFTAVNYEVPGHTNNSREWAHKITNRFEYNTNIFVMSPESIQPFLADVASDAVRNHYNIGYFYWELPEFPEEWVPGLDLMDEIWTSSEFTKEAFEKKSKTPVYILPSSISETKENGLARADFGLPEQKFLFLVMYDIQSTAARKNPQGAVRAFQEAFGDQEDVGLVVKVNPPRNWDGRDPVLDRLRGQKNVYILAETYSKPRLNALVDLCDASVSLHRSEGFGMCPAEAMFWGKPAVLTDWSGNQVYMTTENCCPVPCEIVEIDQDYGPYKKGGHWAEPDIYVAAEYMRRLVNDHSYYQTIARKGQQTILTEFSVEAVGKRIRARLTEQGLL